MNVKKIFFLIILCSLFFKAQAHKVYVSNTELRINNEKNRAECILTVFTDDLETVISQTTENSFKLSDTINLEEKEKIQSYIFSHFVISTKEKTLSPKWVSLSDKVFEIEIFFSFDLPKRYSGLNIENRIFIDVFEKQINNVTVTNDGSHFIFDSKTTHFFIPKQDK